MTAQLADPVALGVPLQSAVVAVMRRFFDSPHGAAWTVAYSAEEQAVAVVFRGGLPEGSLPGVRRSHLHAWSKRLEAGGLDVELRFDGPRGQDPEAPWWLRVTPAFPYPTAMEAS